jgi:hypothetical protein
MLLETVLNSRVLANAWIRRGGKWENEDVSKACNSLTAIIYASYRGSRQGELCANLPNYLSTNPSSSLVSLSSSSSDSGTSTSSSAFLFVPKPPLSFYLRHLYLLLSPVNDIESCRFSSTPSVLPDDFKTVFKVVATASHYLLGASSLKVNTSSLSPCACASQSEWQGGDSSLRTVELAGAGTPVVA